MWLHDSWLCQVEILSTFYVPYVMELLLSPSPSPLSSLPTPEKPEICFWMTFIHPSPTSFIILTVSEMTNYDMAHQIGHIYLFTAACSQPYSPPPQQTDVCLLLCSSSPSPYPAICPHPFLSSQACPFPFAEKLNLKPFVADLKECCSLLLSFFLCSHSFSLLL